MRRHSHVCLYMHVRVYACARARGEHSYRSETQTRNEETELCNIAFYAYTARVVCMYVPPIPKRLVASIFVTTANFRSECASPCTYVDRTCRHTIIRCAACLRLRRIVCYVRIFFFFTLQYLFCTRLSNVFRCTITWTIYQEVVQMQITTKAQFIRWKRIEYDHVISQNKFSSRYDVVSRRFHFSVSETARWKTDLS